MSASTANPMPRLVTALFASTLGTTLACDSSPLAVEPVEIVAVDRTAIFDGLRVQFMMVNYSWMPREGPIPEADERLITVEVMARSITLETRSIEPSDFRLRTWDGTELFDPAKTTLWTAESGGREPVFDSIQLENGESVRAWLTFRVPRSRSHLPDVLLWMPDPRVAFSFSLPTRSASLVCGLTRVFGTVTDPGGSPVEGASIELADYSLGRSGNSFEGGQCRGEPTVVDELATNRSGEFENQSIFRFCDPRCIELTGSGPEGSGLGTVQITGGVIWPSPPHPLVEPSELRIDATLPFGNR